MIVEKLWKRVLTTENREAKIYLFLEVAEFLLYK
jgi:hypothetical protein